VSRREVQTVKILRPLSTRLCIPCLCLIVALLAGCSFDSSQLRALSSDGATDQLGYGGAIKGAGGLGGQGGVSVTTAGAGGAGVSETGGAGQIGGQTVGGGTGGQAATCVSGASVACTCPTGQQGAQTCTSAGTFAPCVCSVPTVDAGGAGGGDGAATRALDAPDATGGTTHASTGGTTYAPTGGTTASSTGTTSCGAAATICTPVPKSTGGICCPNGKCVVGAYSGATLAYTDGTSTICMSANGLCATGNTNALNSTNTTANWGVVFGFYLSPNSTPTNLVGVQLAGSGISVNLSSLPAGAQARVQVSVGATGYYCAVMSTASQTLPWTSFNTARWNNTGTYLTGAPTAATQILITVSSETGVAGSFDLCVTSLSFPGSETCPRGDHDDGTGNCVVNGTCATGYHDSGTGTCVVSGTCWAGYHNGGGGTCVASGTCSAGYNNCSGTCSSSSCGGTCPIENCDGDTGVCTCE
jgi:hypothetical protein